MADGSPPTKRPKTSSDGFNLGDELPDDLLGLSNGPPSLNSNGNSQSNASVLPQSQATNVPNNGTTVSISQASHPATNVQAHKKLTQLLTNDHNSPLTASPVNPAAGSPHPSRSQQPQQSPVPNVMMSMQSPGQATSNVISNSNIKSPLSSMSGPRSVGAHRGTPSPRVQSSIPLSTSSSPLTCSVASTNFIARSQPGSVNTNLINNIGVTNNAIAQHSTHNLTRPVRSQMNTFVGATGPPPQSSTMMGNRIAMPGNQLPTSMSQGMSTINNLNGNYGNSIRTPNVSAAQAHYQSPQQHQPNLRMQGAVPMSNTNFNNPNMRLQPQQPHMFNQSVGNMQSGMSTGGFNQMDSLQMSQQQQQINYGSNAMQKMPMSLPSRLPTPGAISSGGAVMVPGGQPTSMNIHAMHQNNRMIMQPSQQNQARVIAPQQQQQANFATSNGGQMNRQPSSAGVDPEKRKLIQQQLFLLLHAHKCLKAENAANGEQVNCTVIHCRTMKTVLQHMNSCSEGKQCQIAHCASSRQIIAHWKQCKRDDCSVCLPLKNHHNQGNPNNRPYTHSVQSSQPPSNSISTTIAGGMNNPSQQITPMDSKNAIHSNVPNTTMSLPEKTVQDVLGLENGWKVPAGALSVSNSSETNPRSSSQSSYSQPSVQHEWHTEVKDELRNYLVQKLVQNIFPSPEKISANDNRMIKLLSFARKVESNMYETAKSREEYYHSLAEKIYKIQKELEEKRNQKLIKPNPNQGTFNNNNIYPTMPPRQGNHNNITTSSVMVSQELIPASNGVTQSATMQKFHAAQTSIKHSKQAMSTQYNPFPNQPNDDQGSLTTNNIHSDPNQLQPGMDSPMLPPMLPMSGSNSADNKLQQRTNMSEIIVKPEIPKRPFKPNPPQPSIPSSINQNIPPNNLNQSTVTTAFPCSGVTMTTTVTTSVASSISCMPSTTSIKTELTTSYPSHGMQNNQPSNPVKQEPSSGAFPSRKPAAIKSETTSSVKTEPPKSPSDSSSSKTTPDVKREIVFPTSELVDALMPIWEKLHKQEPEGAPFRQPVDPERLQIPDYFDVVKNPMDLSSIRKKLETGEYREPWAFIDDVWLMFHNAWLYNRKTSKVYKYCSRLKEIFEQDIDTVMQGLGYCCGRKLEFSPMTLCCYGKTLCTIQTGAVYYEYRTSGSKFGINTDRYDYCEKCYKDIPGDFVTISDEPGGSSSSGNRIPKSQFKKKKNDVLDPEPFVQCGECGRKLHTICVLHHNQIWTERFVCDKCHLIRKTQRKQNRFMSSKLPTNKLSDHIENRVNGYLRRNDTDSEAGYIHIRVVYSGDKQVDVRSGMKAKFVDTKEMPESFPYKAKAFFAFEEIDGVDICFFGVHVQEYPDAPAPNSRRVYLSYLDSVKFFRPRHLRTAVYHEILIGYFDFCRNLGYEFAHIWACPPSEGDDYIFHCHPPEQKIPKPKRLQDWYKKMLDKAIVDQVVMEYNDIFKQAKDDRLQSARELPYFEGDFWPNVLEESIKELEQEEEDRKQAEVNEQAAAEEGQGSKNDKKQKTKKATNKKASQRNAKKKIPQVASDLSDKLYQIMEKHKEVFFVIRLQSAESAAKIGPITDPDPLLPCELMDGRDAFLTLAREKHYEFSSLRRTKWSTMAMLVELHLQGQDKFVYTCNNCKNSVETRYHCQVCEDYDLCVPCYRKVGHEHKMDHLGLGLDDGTPGSGSNQNALRRNSVQRCITSLVHACQCRNANCQIQQCIRMKKVVTHTKNCKKKSYGGCPICTQLIALCLYHAKFCQETKCLVPFCFNLKSKIKQQEQAQRQRQDMLMIRRMKNMTNNQNKENESQGPRTPGNSDAPCKPATPKPDHQPPTPNPTQRPSTPGGSHGPPTPGGSKLKQMVSPPGGKVLPSGMNQQRNNQMMVNAGMQPGMGHPNSIQQPGQHPSNMGNQPQQNPNMYSGNQMNMYNRPPPGAVIAAKEAQNLARLQATDTTKYPATNFPSTRPGGTPSMQQQRPFQQPMVNAQSPYPATGGRSPNDSTYGHNPQGAMPPMTSMRVQPRPTAPTIMNNAGIKRKPQPPTQGMIPSQIRKMHPGAGNPMMIRRAMQQTRPIISDGMPGGPVMNAGMNMGMSGMQQQQTVNMQMQQSPSTMPNMQWSTQPPQRMVQQAPQQQFQQPNQQPAPPYQTSMQGQQHRMIAQQQPNNQKVRRHQIISRNNMIMQTQMQPGMQNQMMQNQGQPMMSPQQNMSISHNQGMMSQNMSGQQQPMNSIVMQQGGAQQQRPGMVNRTMAMVSHGGPNRNLSGQVMVNASPNQMITSSGMDHFSVPSQQNNMGTFPRTMGMNNQMAFAVNSNGQMNPNDMMSPNDSLEKYVTNTE